MAGQGVRCTAGGTWPASCRGATPSSTSGWRRPTGPPYEATSPADGEARLRRLVADLECPLRLRRRLRSTNLLERSLEEVKRRTKVIGRFRGETSCLSLCWAVLDLFIASARGLALTALERRQLAQMRAARMAQTPDSLTA